MCELCGFRAGVRELCARHGDLLAGRVDLGLQPAD